MIHFNQVSKAINDVTLFQNISFFLPKASYTCITGLSNSGKTTLLQLICGEQSPDSGTLIINEMDLSELPENRLPFLRRQIGLVESTPLLLDDRSVADNISMPLEIAGFDRRAQQERLNSTLDQLGLTLISDVTVNGLSPDQRWLTACARATIHRPAILLIDEPVNAISQSTIDRQQQSAEQLMAYGTTVVAVCKDLPTCKTGRLELTQGRVIHHEYTTTEPSSQL